MLNSKPNNKNYTQGLYIPKYKEKVLKLNNQGGIYFRSSWEKKFMIYLDHNSNVKSWSSEGLKIPYQLIHNENGIPSIKNHTYYPDFCYTILLKNGDVKTVIAEIKPQKEYKNVLDIKNGTLNIPENASVKKLKNLEYDIKTARRNSEKWETMIEWCNKKRYSFIVITEEHLKRINC